MNLDKLVDIVLDSLLASEQLCTELGLTPEEQELVHAIAVAARGAAICKAGEVCANIHGRDRRGLMISAGLAMALKQSEIQNQHQPILRDGQDTDWDGMA